MARERRVAALDTCALSFYQQGRIPSAGEDDRKRADKIEHYMACLLRDGGDVYLPALCLGEYLSQFADGDRDSIREGIEENYIIIEYGVEAARAFAKMRHDKEAFAAARAKSQKPSQCIKVDCLIAATALGRLATEILTDNTRDFSGLSRDRLSPVLIDSLPPPPAKQTIIPFDQPPA